MFLVTGLLYVVVVVLIGYIVYSIYRTREFSISDAAASLAAIIALIAAISINSSTGPSVNTPTASPSISVPISTLTAGPATSTPLAPSPSIGSITPGVPTVVILQGELKVEPPLATDSIGFEHVIYITLRTRDGFPMQRATVYLAIVSGPHMRSPITLTTDQQGQVTFTYTGEKVGEDIIRVWAGTPNYNDALTTMKHDVTEMWIPR